MIDNSREYRGREIADDGRIVGLDAKTFLVPSQSSERQYKVENLGITWVCECPDFLYRAHQVGECKHIHAVRFFTAFQAKVQEESTSAHVVCPVCSSVNVNLSGNRITRVGPRQRFLCADCGRYFTENQAFNRMSATPKIVALALDLYWKGTSYRKIQDTIKQFENLGVNHTTVYRWVQRYMELVTQYVNKLEPKLSGIWHADEAMLKVKHAGSESRKDESKWVWLWNVLDHDTRFLICNQISQQRALTDAKRLLSKARKVGKPSVLVTDGLTSYKPAFLEKYAKNGKDSPRHVVLASIRDKTNNNSVERFHGTVRERDKVLRALDRPKTAKKFHQAYRTYYNFIRPHQTLNGKTPAEQAGVNLGLGTNKWLALIQKAQSQATVAINSH